MTQKKTKTPKPAAPRKTATRKSAPKKSKKTTSNKRFKDGAARAKAEAKAKAKAAADSESGRKERVLHTRIPAVLEQELKRAAESLRVPVSNLVRNILEDAIATAEELGRAADREVRRAAEMLGAIADGVTPPPASQDAAPPKRDPLAGVVGYQPLVLAIETRCTVCRRDLAPGEDAFLAIRATPGRPLFIGQECLPEL